jgi:hypothetical protein
MSARCGESTTKYGWIYIKQTQRYFFRSGLTSPLLVRGPHYTHVYLLHAVYCQTLLASQLDFGTYFARPPYTLESVTRRQLCGIRWENLP